jgi:hypothetical protein
MHGVIAGAYACKARGLSYTYEIEWVRDETILRWSGDVSQGRRRVFARGELSRPGTMDSGDAVRLGIAIWIEDYSRNLEGPQP